MAPLIIVLAVLVVFLACVATFVLILLKNVLRIIPLDRALIVHGNFSVRVCRHRALVPPIICRTEEVDLTARMMRLDRRGRSGLVTADGLKIDLSAQLSVRVLPTPETLLPLAERHGAAHLTDVQVLDPLFRQVFNDAIAAFAAGRTLKALQDTPAADLSRDLHVHLDGLDIDWGGYSLCDAQLFDLAPTPLDDLDPSDPVDAAVIRRAATMAATIAAKVAPTD